uniref:hypothetical protein n=1 Tax=Jannaschia marina TaxID=2741674 RepID=UPI0015C81D2B
FALNAAACRFLFAISSVSFSKTKMTSDRSSRQRPISREHLIAPLVWGVALACPARLFVPNSFQDAALLAVWPFVMAFAVVLAALQLGTHLGGTVASTFDTHISLCVHLGLLAFYNLGITFSAMMALREIRTRYPSLLSAASDRHIAQATSLILSLGFAGVGFFVT